MEENYQIIKTPAGLALQVFDLVSGWEVRMTADSEVHRESVNGCRFFVLKKEEELYLFWYVNNKLFEKAQVQEFSIFAEHVLFNKDDLWYEWELIEKKGIREILLGKELGGQRMFITEDGRCLSYYYRGERNKMAIQSYDLKVKEANFWLFEVNTREETLYLKIGLGNSVKLMKMRKGQPRGVKSSNSLVVEFVSGEDAGRYIAFSTRKILTQEQTILHIFDENCLSYGWVTRGGNMHFFPGSNRDVEIIVDPNSCGEGEKLIFRVLCPKLNFDEEASGAKYDVAEKVVTVTLTDGAIIKIELNGKVGPVGDRGLKISSPDA